MEFIPFLNKRNFRNCTITKEKAKLVGHGSEYL
jgi:hypothetical protein